MRLLGGISTVAHVLTHPLRLLFPRDCLFIGIVNDKGRYPSLKSTARERICGSR